LLFGAATGTSDEFAHALSTAARTGCSASVPLVGADQFGLAEDVALGRVLARRDTVFEWRRATTGLEQ